MKFPIILPRGHPVTKLIVKYYHEMANNAAGDFLKSSAAREEIRSWENKCSECRKMKTKLARNSSDGTASSNKAKVNLSSI